jgi:hypothetical protein
VVATQKLKVDYLKLMQGDGSIPFLEEPEGGIKAATTPALPAPSGPFSPLNSGPSADHAWRGQRVHRLHR